MGPDSILGHRPVDGWSSYRTPIRGLYLCGSATHPGGAVSGAPGHNAAAEAIRDLRDGPLSSDEWLSTGTTDRAPPRPRRRGRALAVASAMPAGPSHSTAWRGCRSSVRWCAGSSRPRPRLTDAGREACRHGQPLRADRSRLVDRRRSIDSALIDPRPDRRCAGARPRSIRCGDRCREGAPRKADRDGQAASGSRIGRRGRRRGLRRSRRRWTGRARARSGWWSVPGCRVGRAGADGRRRLALWGGRCWSR